MSSRRTRTDASSGRRGVVQRGRARVDRVRVDLHDLRARNRMVDAGFRTWERDSHVGGGVLAAALAFRIFLFMVPFIFTAALALPVAADASGTGNGELIDRLGIAGLAARAIRNAGTLTPRTRIWLLITTVVALVIATRALLRVLRMVYALAWHIPLARVAKPRVVRDTLITIAGVAGILALGALASGLRSRLGVFGIVPIGIDWLLVGVVWFFVELYLPHERERWTDLVPGAALVALGAWALQIATVVWYARSFAHKSTTFGAIGAALTILAWAYLLGRIVVTAASLNAALVDARHGDTAPPVGEPTFGSAPARPGDDDRPGDHHGEQHLDDTELQPRVRQDHEQGRGQPEGHDHREQHTADDA